MKYRPSLLVVIGSALIGLVQAAGASPLLHGDWQCSTQFSRPEGNYRLQATTQLNKDGSFTSQGTLYAFNALIGNEIPLAFTAQGAWQAQGDTISGTVKQGDITTGVALLDWLADMLEAEVIKQPHYASKIKKLNRQALVIDDASHHPVACINPHQVAQQ